MNRVKRAQLALVVVLVLTTFGTGAWLRAGGGHELVWAFHLVQGVLVAAALAFFGRSVDAAAAKATGRADPGSDAWWGLAVAGAIPLVRIVAEVRMVSLAASAASLLTPDDRRVVERARRLMIARAIVSVVQLSLPWSLSVLPFAWIVANHWLLATTLMSLASLALVAVATQLVVAALAAGIDDRARVSLGGAGSDEPIAVSTVR